MPHDRDRTVNHDSAALRGFTYLLRSAAGETIRSRGCNATAALCYGELVLRFLPSGWGRVTADDARRLVCADCPDARGITHGHLRAVARLPCDSAWRVCRPSRTPYHRQRPECVSDVVPDHERLVAVRSQVAIRSYSCRLARLRRARHPKPVVERECEARRRARRRRHI